MQDQNFIDNEWRPARGGATDDIVNPATGARDRHGAGVRRRPTSTTPSRRPAGPSRSGRPRPRASAARRSTSWPAAIEGDIEHLSAIESENVGKPVSIMEFEMDLTLDNWKFFAAAGRFLEGRAAGEYMAGLHVDAPAGAARRHRLDRAVELPAQHGHLEGGAGAGRRQHRRAQALRAHALHRAAPGRAGRRRAPAGRAQRGVRAGRDRGCRARRPRRRGDGVAHRLGGGRQGHRQGLLGDAQARPPRARRQGAGRGVRRRRPRPRSPRACAPPATTTPVRTAPPRAA